MVLIVVTCPYCQTDQIAKRGRLLLDSRVFLDKQLNERAQQRFTPLSHVVNKLKETQVKWEFLL